MINAPDLLKFFLDHLTVELMPHKKEIKRDENQIRSADNQMNEFSEYDRAISSIILEQFGSFDI